MGVMGADETNPSDEFKKGSLRNSPIVASVSVTPRLTPLGLGEVVHSGSGHKVLRTSIALKGKILPCSIWIGLLGLAIGICITVGVLLLMAFFEAWLAK